MTESKSFRGRRGKHSPILRTFISNDRGQIVLLGGILITMAFILFSLSLSLLANLGQQTGRETENPVLEDYFLVRRTLESYVYQSLVNATNGWIINCPTPSDIRDYAARLNSSLALVRTLEANRGSSFHGQLTQLSVVFTEVTVGFLFRLADPFTSIADEVKYKFSCVVPPGGGCGLSCAFNFSHDVFI